VDTNKAAFFFGVGVMGVLAGFGFGSTATNKVALLVGAGSLAYANYLAPMVDVSPRAELTESWQESVPSIPSIPFKEPQGGWESWGK
jgi:hypothetical protein